MKKKKIQLILILSLCIIFGSGYFWMSVQNEIKSNGDVEKIVASSDNTALNLIAENEIRKISYGGKGTKEITFVLDENGEWYYEEDPEFLLVKEDVGTMVRYLAGLSASRTIDDPEGELSDYGLDDPLYTIKTTDEVGNERTFLFGDYIDLATSYYFMEEGGESIYLVNSVITSSYCDRTLEDWKAAEEAAGTDA